MIDIDFIFIYRENIELVRKMFISLIHIILTLSNAFNLSTMQAIVLKKHINPEVQIVSTSGH